MLESVNSPTYSINENAFKLNTSSVAFSSPNYSLSSDMKKHPLVEFEEFEEGIEKTKVYQAKKKLTIEIDSSYDFPNNEVQQNKHYQTETPSVENIPMQKEIYKQEDLLSQIESLSQKLYQNNINFQEKTQNYQHLQKQFEDCRKENQILKITLKKKEDSIQTQQDKNDQLIYKLARFQEKEEQEHFYDEKLRQKELKLKEQQKLYEKIVAMNKTLQRELHESDKKIMELERQLQKSVCVTQYENLAKIKESSCKLKESTMKIKENTIIINKENNMQINGLKSLDKKKGSSSQIRKTGRVTSSSANLTKKLQINK